jgi:hypothetical protein
MPPWRFGKESRVCLRNRYAMGDMPRSYEIYRNQHVRRYLACVDTGLETCFTDMPTDLYDTTSAGLGEPILASLQSVQFLASQK